MEAEHSSHVQEGSGTTNNGESNPSSVPGSSMKQILRLRVVHLMAAFILVYVGVEVTIGGMYHIPLLIHNFGNIDGRPGWIVTFIINVRGGGPSSGYISSGFFGGLTLGRVALLWVNKKVGERRVLFVYSLLAIGSVLSVPLIPLSLDHPGVNRPYLALSLSGTTIGSVFVTPDNQRPNDLMRAET
jgi:fucose permease